MGQLSSEFGWQHAQAHTLTTLLCAHHEYHFLSAAHSVITASHRWRVDRPRVLDASATLCHRLQYDLSVFLRQIPSCHRPVSRCCPQEYLKGRPGPLFPAWSPTKPFGVDPLHRLVYHSFIAVPMMVLSRVFRRRHFAECWEQPRAGDDRRRRSVCKCRHSRMSTWGMCTGVYGWVCLKIFEQTYGSCPASS